MSTGADAMGVAAWLTPALIVAVAAGLAHPAVGRPVRPAPLATADPADLLDPDCDPAEAENTSASRGSSSSPSAAHADTTAPYRPARSASASLARRLVGLGARKNARRAARRLHVGC